MAFPTECRVPICRQRVGAKIQCSSCYTAYHPLCGRIAGLHMEMVDPEGPNEPVKYPPPLPNCELLC